MREGDSATGDPHDFSRIFYFGVSSRESVRVLIASFSWRSSRSMEIEEQSKHLT